MFHPPFCPNRECRNHHLSSKTDTWYVKNGSYSSLLSNKIQRFQCLHCGTGFSSRTFSLDIFVQKKLPYRQIFSHLITSSGIRDIARLLKVSPNTINNRISRMARQALAVHTSLSSELSLNEDLVADGFESFVCSQYFPNNINILAGKESQFWFSSDYAHLRRKGRMTAYQKKKNRELQAGFFGHRRSIYRSFKDLVHLSLELQEKSKHSAITLFTDEHPQYARVMHDLSSNEKKRIRHLKISSELPRTVRNDLFSVNYLDREIRKDNSDHTRETVQFARNVCNCMERLAVYRMYHNYTKPYRIGKRADSAITHAERAGIPSRCIAAEMRTVFTQRRFFSRTGWLSISDRLIWLKEISTPLKQRAEYLPAYAWA
jgi:transposase-like protein